MKTLYLVIVQLILSHQLLAMDTIKQSFVLTTIGKIAIYEKNSSILDKTPIIFLHGLYFDHHLWDNQLEKIEDRRVICVDMPMHGKSTEIIANWTLSDCANMFIELLDSLEIEKIYGVGHSWGSMTLLRAAKHHPNRFTGLGLFNMPYQAYSRKEIRKIRLQHCALVFKKTYIKQAAKTLFGASSLETNSTLIPLLRASMSKLSNRTIKYLDKVIRIDATDQSAAIEYLQVPHRIIMGLEDYIVPMEELENGISVTAGHTIPLEQPAQTSEIIQALLKNE